MRILVIGGTGHIGSYLVPRQAWAGHEVAVVARQPQPPHGNPSLGWTNVHWIVAERAAEEATGAWAKRMTALQGQRLVRPRSLW